MNFHADPRFIMFHTETRGSRSFTLRPGDREVSLRDQGFMNFHTETRGSRNFTPRPKVHEVSLRNQGFMNFHTDQEIAKFHSETKGS